MEAGRKGWTERSRFTFFRFLAVGRFDDRTRLPRAPGFQPPAERRILKRQQRRGKKSSILRPGLSDGEGRDRDAARHLCDGKQAVEPFSERVSTGTPSTGKAVIEAVMPGRWAAPPAPAMMALSPRDLALFA